MLSTFDLTLISLEEVCVKFNLTRRVGKKKKNNKLISLEICILMVVYKKHFLFLTSKTASDQLQFRMFNGKFNAFCLPVVVLLLLPLMYQHQEHKLVRSLVVPQDSYFRISRPWGPIRFPLSQMTPLLHPGTFKRQRFCSSGR